ncbi:hypothetical protein L6452_20521 [Arctium lappa]|uniref:Uncharacterized protein n=1 Tax=Arctium lappa TaxID=4217 RepID=A0ACB9BCG3_ARCLA|nr:hypothetical protein L6452_20521 [Arctium lappa]
MLNVMVKTIYNLSKSLALLGLFQLSLGAWGCKVECGFILFWFKDRTLLYHLSKISPPPKKSSHAMEELK